MQQVGTLEALYREHALSVFRFALGLSRNGAEAEDIVAEVFARIATRPHAVKTATARAYLLTIARNVFLDAKHRSQRETRALTEMAQQPTPAAPEDGEGAALQHALQALGGLPEGERAALLLRLDHDMSYEEIAQTLNISLAAAKVRVHRARLKLASARTTGEENEG